MPQTEWQLASIFAQPFPTLSGRALLGHARCAGEFKEEEQEEEENYPKQNKPETWKSGIPPFQDITITLQSLLTQLVGAASYI
jgi:hypothetical protein